MMSSLPYISRSAVVAVRVAVPFALALAVGAWPCLERPGLPPCWQGDGSRGVESEGAVWWRSIHL